MTDPVSTQALTALFQVIAIDLVLAGDNAVVIGLAAAGLPPEQRRRAIIAGIVAATVLRLGFAAVTTQLLQILGLVLAGGILLLWVCWKMWRELRAGRAERDADASAHSAPESDDTAHGKRPHKTFRQAALQILIADVSMSLDNVLAVAGAAREHPYILAFGLLLSVALMGVAADLIGRLLQRHRWIAYIGLAIVFYVACEMTYRGFLELAPVIAK